jgi:[CysO sulfur-carrier protein]-S-L-cysteine hydrolase
MNLWLSEAQAREIAEHALREKPREACGLIGGVNGRAMRIISVANAAANPNQQYYMDEAALTAALFELERGGLSLIGIYHSHPEGEPIPSPTDVRLAAYPGTAYLIVGLKHGQPEFAAWEIRGGEVNRVALTVGGAPPEVQADKTLSPAAKMAIFTSAILAFILLIVLSLSLLPAAPPVPAH